MTRKVNLQKNINEDALTYTLPPCATGTTYNKYYSGCCWHTELRGIPNFWKLTKGKGIKIAVLDTGIAPNHPALKESILEAVDFSRTASNAGDGHGHGTHFAGIIAAREIISGHGGIAPHARLLIGKVLNDNGLGSPKAITNGILWAVDCGADIITLNLGNQVDYLPMKAALDYARRNGVFVISTAGDPASYLKTTKNNCFKNRSITIGSTTMYQNLQFGAGRFVQTPDILVEDSEVISTFPPNGFISMRSPSSATAIVAGVAALALSKHRQFGGTTPINTREDLLDHLTFWTFRKLSMEASTPQSHGRIKSLPQMEKPTASVS